jgi:hypothetical protein
MSEEQKINLNINEGDSFFAHELSINFNPTQFIFDFKCITPRVDARDPNKASINLKHNVIMVEPYHAKRILELLTRVIKKYEEDFGKIEKPKSVKKFEEMRKKEIKNFKEPKQTPAYFG